MLGVALGLLGVGMGFVYMFPPATRELQYQSNKLLPNMELDETQALLLKWRGYISDKDYYDRMQKLGYDRLQADKFEQSNFYYPSPTDLVSWQAREVFEPDMVKKLRS